MEKSIQKRFNRPLILASKSPRRKQLLQDAGFEFVIKTCEIDEVYPNEMPPEQVPEYLAGLKAEAVADFLENDTVILTSDTIVIMDGVIYEKPKDEADSFRMLRALSGNSHTVITGVCLSSVDKKRTFSVRTEVTMKAMTDAEIRYYITNFKPFDKAGSYGIQDWLGLNKIAKVEGCFYNVVGLPVSAVYEELELFH